MARNVPGKKKSEEGADVESAPIEGGSLGVVDTVDGAEKTIAMEGALVKGSASREPFTPGHHVVAKTYKVAGTTGKRDAVGRPLVMYGGAMTAMPIGKIVSEASCDVGLLRQQGVQLEELISEGG